MFYVQTKQIHSRRGAATWEQNKTYPNSAVVALQKQYLKFTEAEYEHGLVS